MARMFHRKNRALITCLAALLLLTSLAWAPSERWVVAATREGAVFLLRPDTGDARVRRLRISARDLAWR